MKLLDIAEEIYSDLDRPTDISIPMIAFWLESNLGNLNNLIGTCYTITDGEVDPELTHDEGNIYKTIYFCKYYSKKINDNLGAAGVAVTEVREGDSVIRMASKTEVARYYNELRKEEQKTLKDLVNGYKLNRSIPRTIEY